MIILYISKFQKEVNSNEFNNLKGIGLECKIVSHTMGYNYLTSSKMSSFSSRLIVRSSFLSASGGEKRENAFKSAFIEGT